MLRISWTHRKTNIWVRYKEGAKGEEGLFRKVKININWIHNIKKWTDGGLEMDREIARRRQRQEVEEEEEEVEEVEEEEEEEVEEEEEEEVEEEEEE